MQSNAAYAVHTMTSDQVQPLSYDMESNTAYRITILVSKTDWRDEAHVSQTHAYDDISTVHCTGQSPLYETVV